MKNMEQLTVKGRAASGLKWMTGADIGSRVFQFAVSIILARLLGPKVFGVFGICLIFFRLAGAVGDVGLGTLLIQKEGTTPRMVNNASLISLLFSTFLCGALYLSAPYLEQYFRYQSLGTVLRAFSFMLIIEGHNTVLRSVLVRDMRFSHLAATQILSLAAGGIVSVALAANSAGAWSLVFGLYVEGIVQAILLLVYCERKVRPSANLAFEKEDVHFAWKILLTRAIYFLNSSLGALLIGRFLGEYALGLYVVAYGVTDMPVQRISKNVGVMSLATLSKFQADSRAFGDFYRTINRYFSLVILAIFVGLIVVAEEYVARFYGVKWLDMVAPLRVLCFVGIFRSFLVVSSAALVSLGRVGTEFVVSLGQSVLILIFVPVLLRFGLSEACFGLAISHGIGCLAAQIAITRGVKGVWTNWLASLCNAAIPAVGMVAVWSALRVLLRSGVSDLTFLAINILCCGTVFVLIAVLMDRTVLTQAWRFIR